MVNSERMFPGDVLHAHRGATLVRYGTSAHVDSFVMVLSMNAGAMTLLKHDGSVINTTEEFLHAEIGRGWIEQKWR